MKTLIALWKKFWENYGLNYKVNLGTKEIHNPNKPHKNCKVAIITHYRLVNKKTAMQLIEGGYDGCRWCMKEFNKESNRKKKV